MDSGLFLFINGSVPPETLPNFLPYGLPPGFILTTMQKVKNLGGICFILGWFAKALTDYILEKIKSRKEAGTCQT